MLSCFCVVNAHGSMAVFACLLLQCCRDETDKQRAELLQQHEAEQKLTVDQLTSLRDSEMDALKQGWQHKVNDLLHEVEN